MLVKQTQEANEKSSRLTLRMTTNIVTCKRRILTKNRALTKISKRTTD